MSEDQLLHITSGDIAGESLRQSGVPGEVFVWHDVLYDGPRKPGWPDEETLIRRAGFLEELTGGGLRREGILEVLTSQYAKLEGSGRYGGVVLWFDACLFDQSMLCHILSCMKLKSLRSVELLCVDAFPDVVPYDGLGQLGPEQLASVYPNRRPVTVEQFAFAAEVDRAFALQDRAAFGKLSELRGPPLPWVPAAVSRWLDELPDAANGLGRLHRLALEAVRSGLTAPSEIFAFVGARDTHPRFWGDITLWARINELARRSPPLVGIEGPGAALPQWESEVPLDSFSVYPAP